MATSRTERTVAANRATAFAYAYCEALVTATGDLTMPMQQVRLLRALAVHGTLNQGDLEQHTGVRKTSNGRNIDRLGSGSFGVPGMGLLESFEDERDRRYKLGRLTPKGRAVMDEAAHRVAVYMRG